MADNEQVNVPVAQQEETPQQETQGETSPQETQEETPPQETQEETPPQETQEETPAQETQEETPAQETQEETPQQETLEETPQQEAAQENEPKEDAPKQDVPKDAQETVAKTEPQNTDPPAESGAVEVDDTAEKPAEQQGGEAQETTQEEKPAEEAQNETPEGQNVNQNQGEEPAKTEEPQEQNTESAPQETTQDSNETVKGTDEVTQETVVDQKEENTETVGNKDDEPELDPGRPTPEPKYDSDATATVKFVLMPSGQVATMRCGLSQTLSELKGHFATELKIPAEMILLMFYGKETKNDISLAELGVGPNGTIQLEMQSADPVNTPLKGFRPKQEYHMPDVITVRVQSETGEWKDIVVEIERTTKNKPFLGGYRHKTNGVVFHHASAQTVQKQKPPSNVELFCRDTQTVQLRHEVQQTTNDMSTQMTKIGVYVSNMKDKLVVPGKYTTADDFRSNILNQVVVIQKYYRRWLARRYVEKVRDDTEKRQEWEREEEIRKKKEKEDRIKREFERRMNPKTKEDFDLLYHALEKWRQEEETRINENLTGAERKAALCQLLDQETQLIASVGRHKLGADDDSRKKKVQGFLDKAAAPKKWKGPDGKTTEMDTPYTIRAQELREIYQSINMKYLTQDERLDVLLTLKHTVKEHDCKLTQDIIELIDREADLLMRGVKEDKLDGLRKRVATLFLQYIKTPTFNPEAARLLKVPQDPQSLRKNIYFCPSCNQYLPSTEFHLSSNSSTVGRCHKCTKTDNEARVRQDYSHYRYMLKNLRRQEEAYNDGSKIAFLMQEHDLRHLVENVWNNQSILSAWEDLYDLVLVRWNKHEEWAPWNCILMTKEEASAHNKLENLEEAYGKNFIHKVKHKHTLARNYFSRLPGMAEHMRSVSNEDARPTVSGKRLIQPTVKAS